MGRATGGAGERILLGSNNYDPRTGQWRNVGAGLLGRAAQTVIGAFGGPLIGAIAGRGISKMVDKYGKDPQFVQPEAIQVPIDWGAPQSAQGAFTAPSPMAAPQAVQNLGLGAQTPGNSWAGYMQGQGSANNFGNQQFGSGMASQPGSWGPQSQWGQQVTAQPVTQGSSLGFGNNVQQFSGGSEGGGSAGYSRGSSGMPGTMGGRLAGDSMITVARRWANK
jgi:hypothetical protein